MANSPAIGTEDKRAPGSRRSLKRVLVLGIILVCGALVGLESWTSWRSRLAVEADTRADTETLTLSLTEHATNTIDSVDTILRQAVELLEHDGLSAEMAARLHTLYTERNQSMGQVDFFFVVDAEGRWQASSTPILSTTSVADRDYFVYHRDHPDRGLHFSGIVTSRYSGAQVIVVSRRFDRPDGSFGGIALAALKPAFFQGFFDSLATGRDGAVAMSLDDGTLLVRHPAAPDQIGLNFGNSKLFTEYLPQAPQGSFFVTSTIDGILRWASYRRVPGTPLVVTTALSSDERLAEWRRQTLTHAAGILSIVLILGGLGGFLIIQIGRIEQSQRAAAAAAAEARAMGAQYRLLAENSKDMIVRIGMDGIRHYASPACRSLLGYEPEVLTGVDALELVHPEDRDRCGEHVRQVARGLAEPYYTYRLRHRDGHFVWVEATTHFVLDPETGAPVEFINVVRDISQRREAETRLLDAIESLEDGFTLWDAEWRLIMCNSRCREIYAASADMLVPGVSIRTMYTEGARRGSFGVIADPEAFADAAMDEGIQPGNLIERQFGERWIQSSKRRTTMGGWVGIYTDVTERRQRELDLAEARDQLENQAAALTALAGDFSVAKDEAERANRVKSEFLATMSHEIRTPMNGIIGMNALLMTTELTHDQRKFADAVRLSADSLMSIINDILDVSKLEAGKVELEAIDFSLETLIEDAVELMAPRAHDKGLEIAVDLAPLAGEPLRGDPARLRQILLNLLSNAVKFTERGYVAVEARLTPEGTSGFRIQIAVADTGIGIDQAVRAKLFQRFAQADGSITRRFGGTGLGLNISRQLVELMGGSIAVSARPEGGSVFEIDLVLPRGSAVPVPPPLLPDALAGRIVLVVDDLPINRAILRRQLAAFGALCVEAESGEAALAALATADRAGRAVDLVLLDQMMPGTSGDAVAVAIRGHAEWQQPKIVLISSAGVSPSEAAALDSGLDRILLKPVRQHELFECLARLFGVAPALRSLPPATAQAAVVAGGTAHLLLVEDHAINREVARAVLERFGYTVDMAEDGVAAVEAVQDGAYALVLMDVQMPRLDGLEATRQIRALGNGFARLPIIAMTANAMQGDAARCFEAGMNDYIAKPIDPEEVRAKLVYWLAATRRAGQSSA